MVEAVDIAEESQRHKDEWLLFEVTEVDEIDRPVKGRLLFHGKSRAEVHEAAMQVRDKETYVFFTGPVAPPDVVVVL